ncbi:MAG: glycine cleavage system protein GcvH [Gammaproteobacteria bacterium]|jgi:glycine cleavage system H protein
MSNTPSDLKYTKSHEWVRDNGDGTVTLGITDHAQELLGDLVFVEVPESGTDVEAGGEIAVVESVKAASDVYSPVTGEVVEANEALADAPESVNDSPYESGWICKIRLSDNSQLEALMDADSYATHAEEEEH